MPGRILVVDDSPTDQQAMRKPLESSGYQVMTAMNGVEARKMLESDQYDMILLDVIMPEQNGFQLCRELRRDSRYENMPIIMVTSKDQAADRFWGMKQGATEYLTKPFDATELIEVVRKHS